MVGNGRGNERTNEPTTQARGTTTVVSLLGFVKEKEKGGREMRRRKKEKWGIYGPFFYWILWLTEYPTNY